MSTWGCSPHGGGQAHKTAQVPNKKGVVQKTVVCLHNGILHSRKKGAPTLGDSMDGTGEHYAK